MKSKSLDLYSQTNFVHRSFNLDDHKQDTLKYLSMSTMFILFICFFLLQIIFIGFISGWPFFLLTGGVFFVSGTLVIQDFLKVEVVNKEGIFITNQYGKIKRRLPWSKVQNVSYHLFDDFYQQGLVIEVHPKQERGFRYQTTSPVLAAYIYTFCCQQLSDESEAFSKWRTPYQNKSDETQNPLLITFEQTVKDLLTKSITPQQLNQQKEHSLNEETDEISSYENESKRTTHD